MPGLNKGAASAVEAVLCFATVVSVLCAVTKQGPQFEGDDPADDGGAVTGLASPSSGVWRHTAIGSQ